MAGLVVSASKGVIGPLVAKLTDLIVDKGDKYGADLMGVSKDIVFLRDELSSMNALLDTLQDTNELSPQVKNWRDQVREAAYDIEDCIDDFITKLGSASAHAGFINNLYRFLQTSRARLDAAMQIKELKTRLQDINDRRKRYKFEDSTSITTLVDLDPRLSALYKESTMLVGIESQKEKLARLITDGVQQLKVVSIVGFGGLGKTTLANEVYHEVKGHFDCTAFVSVSQKPDIARLLNSVLSQIGQDPSYHASELRDHINRLREYLQEKRYFIIVDDLWGVLAWDNISCAFPQNDKHSRVIVTTRIKDVARACCSDQGCIHNMEPLSEPDSRKLFFSRLFGPEDTCPPELTEVTSKILKKCGGLPLAIMTVASTLACGIPTSTGLKEHCECIYNSLATQSETNPTLEPMMHILDLSYKNLPRHLKACFLYLGIYPEDFDIRRDDVIQQWVAEGFVSNIYGHDAWDVAKSYFNDLVNRSMIQHACDVWTYRVHDMMLDLIIRRCREEDFIIVSRDPQAVAEIQGRVRRLSADFRFADHGTMVVTNTNRLSKLRSVAMFGGLKLVPTLMQFKFLRVLFLEFRDTFRIDFTGIGLLSQLRYLRVRCVDYSVGNGSEYSIVLPSQIRRLQQLETLELPAIPGCNIPSDIVELPRLFHLVVPWNTRLPDGTCKMKSLRVLDGPSLPKSTLEDIKGLGELTNLTKLSLYCHKRLLRLTPRCSMADDTTRDLEAWMAALSSSLEKLDNLKEFSLMSFPFTYCADGLLRAASSLAPLRSLKRLHLSEWTFSRVPRWMANNLHNLRYLRLGVKQVLQEDISILGALQSLRTLCLRIPSSIPAERIVIGSTTGFDVVESFELNRDRLSCLIFEAGAMPKLRRLDFSLDALEWDKATPAGLEHLSSLKEIDVYKVYYGDGDHATLSGERVDIIRGVFQEAANAVPSHPKFVFHNDISGWRPRE